MQHGGVGHHGNDADRPAAQLGADLLLDRGEVGVEIDEEPVDVGAGEGFERWMRLRERGPEQFRGIGFVEVGGFNCFVRFGDGSEFGDRRAALSRAFGSDLDSLPLCIYFRLLFS